MNDYGGRIEMHQVLENDRTMIPTRMIFVWILCANQSHFGLHIFVNFFYQADMLKHYLPT
jgi:hypothetical protein